MDSDLGTIDDLPKDYVEELAAKGTLPLWPSLRRVLPYNLPEHATRPYRWRYDELRPYVMKAGELAPIEKAERRVIVLANPGLGLERMMATPAIYLGLQLIRPGEFAPNHRHTPAAVRFVIEGSGAFTTVDGQQCRMEPRDLILTPSGLWHEHSHEGDGPVVWLDALDLPIVHYLESSYAEEGAPQKANHPIDASQRDYRRAGMVPYQSLAGPKPDYPMLRYPWAEVRRALVEMSRHRPKDETVRLAYVNPETGAPCLPILGFSAELIRPGQETAPRRCSSSAVFHVAEGRGESEINGQVFDWRESDSIAIPGHARVTHRAAPGKNPAFLFHIDDAPLQRAMGIYREY